MYNIYFVFVARWWWRWDERGRPRDPLISAPCQQLCNNRTAWISFIFDTQLIGLNYDWKVELIFCTHSHAKLLKCFLSSSPLGSVHGLRLPCACLLLLWRWANTFLYSALVVDYTKTRVVDGLSAVSVSHGIAGPNVGILWDCLRVAGYQ